MMRLTSTVVWKSWASEPLRLLLSLAGIACGVAVVVAIFVMDHNVAVKQDAKPLGSIDLELSPLPNGDAAGVAPGEILAALRQDEDLAEAGIWREAQVWATGPNGAVDVGPLQGVEPLDPGALGMFRVVAGRVPNASAKLPEVAIGQGLVATGELAVGDQLTLNPRPKKRLRCVDGKPVMEEVETPAPPQVCRVVGILGTERLGGRHQGRIVLGPARLAGMLNPNARARFPVQRRYGTDKDRLTRRLRQTFQVEDPRAGMVGEKADERAFRNGVKVFGGLALVVGMFVVFQTLSQSLVVRLRQLGLLRALGASRRQLGGVFLADALAQAAMGSALGVALGIGLARALKAVNVSSLGVGRGWSGFEIPPGPVLWTVALAFVFTVGGAAFPLWKARHLPVARILSGAGSGGGGGAAGGQSPVDELMAGVNRFLFVLLVAVLPAAYLVMTPLITEESLEMLLVLGQMAAWVIVFGTLLLLAPKLVVVSVALVGWPLRRMWPLAGQLFTNQLHRQPGRIAATVCGLSIVLLALLGLKSLTAALGAEVGVFDSKALSGRVFLEHSPRSPEEVRELKEQDGIAAVVPIRGRLSAPFLLSGLDADDLARPGGALEGRDKLVEKYATRRSVVVSVRFARLKKLRVGDALTVTSTDGPQAYEVLAISDRSGFVPDERAWAVADPKWLSKDLCAPIDLIEQSIVMLDPKLGGGAASRVLDALRKGWPPYLKGKTGAGIAAYHQRDVTRDFLLFDLLVLLTLGLATVGLVNSMTIAAIGRARELGVLRALGMGRRDLRRVFLLEGATVAVLGSFVALALSWPLGYVLVAGLNGVAGLEAPHVIPWGWVAAVPLIAAVIGAFAAVFPTRRVAKIPLQEAVRFE